MAHGVDDDTFLHLVDAWVESKMSGRGSRARIDAACREMRVFTEAVGDRFEGPAELARALEDWTLRVDKAHPKGRELVTEVLAMWRAFDS